MEHGIRGEGGLGTKRESPCGEEHFSPSPLIKLLNGAARTRDAGAGISLTDPRVSEFLNATPSRKLQCTGHAPNWFIDN